MMDRREALLLVERLRRRTRDPDVLTLCNYVHGTDVHGTIPSFRRPGTGHHWLCLHLPDARCVRGTSSRRGSAAEKMAPWSPSPRLGLLGRRVATAPKCGSAYPTHSSVLGGTRAFAKGSGETRWDLMRAWASQAP